MTWKDYLYDRKWFLLGCVACGLLMEGVLLLFHGSGPEQIFVMGTFGASVMLFLVLDYRKRSRFYNRIRNTLDGLKEKWLLVELLTEPDFLEGKLTLRSYEEILKSMNDEIGRHERRSNEFKSYVEAWIHEIKLPIASATLMLHRLEGDGMDATLRKLKGQLRRIEEDVEQVLYYVRSEVPEKDYVIAEHSLRDVVSDVVRDQKDSLIMNHFSVQLELAKERVRTDKKWLQFMLRQIISNAVKYAGEEPRTLRIAAVTSREGNEERVRLFVEDNGRGIPDQDLPRIFEKSFTGQNGRSTPSTGMGLYVCKRLCDELGHGIGAESQVGAFTRIWLEFTQSAKASPILTKT